MIWWFRRAGEPGCAGVLVEAERWFDARAWATAFLGGAIETCEASAGDVPDAVLSWRGTAAPARPTLELVVSLAPWMPGAEPLAKADREAISHATWCERAMGWNITGSRAHQRRTLVGLERRGLLESVGPVVMCDGDGFHLDPERFRHGWRLTAWGKRVAERLDADASAAPSGAQEVA